MSGQKLKQGYMRKFAKGIIGESWKKVFVEVYSDGLFCWYKKKKDSSRKGSVLLRDVCEYLTIGSYCRAIPFSPQLPSGGRLDYMIAFPVEPNKKSKIHFFLCDSEQEFSDWMSAITSTFPSAPSQQQQQQQQQQQSAHQQQQSAHHQPVVGAGPYNAFSPAPSAPMGGPPQSTASPHIGFEALTISNSSHANSSHSPGGYGAPQPMYAQAGYPPQQPYPQQPYPQQPYPQQPYPQQPYPQQPYAQQPYPQAPQGYQQNPYAQQYPQYQNHGGPFYPGQPGQPYHPPPPQTTTVIVQDHRSRGGSGMGNMAAGALGGAVAGYAASRMFGGWGGGYGWGHGSWGSCSWSSGSWGSCSGGSWGSFD